MLRGGNFVDVIRKDRASTVEYEFDWTDLVETGESIVDSEWEHDAGIDLSAASINGSTTSALISGGTGGTSFRVANTIRIDSGEIERRTILVGVFDQAGLEEFESPPTLVMTGLGFMDISAEVVAVAALSMSGSAEMTLSAVPAPPTELTMTGTGDMSIAAVVVVDAAITMDGTAAMDINAEGFGTSDGAIAMDGTGEMSLSAVVVVNAAIAMDASAEMTVSSVKLYDTAITMSGTGAMALDAVVSGEPNETSILMAGTGEMSVAAVVVVDAAITMDGTSTMAVNAVQLTDAAIAMGGTGEMDLAADVVASGSITMAQTGTMAVAAGVVVNAAITMAQTSTMAISAEVPQAALGVPLASNFTVWQMGPIKVGSSYYVFVPVDGTQPRQHLACYKSADLSTWVEQNAANRPNSDQEATHTYNDGLIGGAAKLSPNQTSLILCHVVASKNDTSSTTVSYFIPFDTSTDTWGNSGTMTVLGISAPISNTTTPRPALSGVPVMIGAASATSNLACLTQGTAISGTQERIACAYRRNNGTTWNAMGPPSTGNIGSTWMFASALIDNPGADWFRVVDSQQFDLVDTVTAYRYTYDNTAYTVVYGEIINSPGGGSSLQTAAKGEIRGQSIYCVGTTWNSAGGANAQFPELYGAFSTTPAHHRMSGAENQVSTSGNTAIKLSEVVACFDPTGGDYYVFFRRGGTTEMRVGIWDGSAWTYESLGNLDLSPMDAVWDAANSRCNVLGMGSAGFEVFFFS